MAQLVWRNGLGSSLGDPLLTDKPLLQSGTTWFVSSTTGSDSNGGEDRDDPFATLGHANGVSSEDDIIVLLSGHTEVISSPVNVNNQGLSIVGEGSSGGVPTVHLSANQAAGCAININGEGVLIGNIKFLTNAQSNTKATVESVGRRTIVRGCYFEVTSTDTAGGLKFKTSESDPDFWEVRDTVFISTATSLVTRPPKALIAETTVHGLIEDTVFSGGTYGFSGNALSVSTTHVRFARVSLLLGADALLGDTGYISNPTATGSAVIAGLDD